MRKPLIYAIIILAGVVILLALDRSNRPRDERERVPKSNMKMFTRAVPMRPPRPN
jgi:hypothetical protein